MNTTTHHDDEYLYCLPFPSLPSRLQIFKHPPSVLTVAELWQWAPILCVLCMAIWLFFCFWFVRIVQLAYLRCYYFPRNEFSLIVRRQSKCVMMMLCMLMHMLMRVCLCSLFLQKDVTYKYKIWVLGRQFTRIRGTLRFAVGSVGSGKPVYRRDMTERSEIETGRERDQR